VVKRGGGKLSLGLGEGQAIREGAQVLIRPKHPAPYQHTFLGSARICGWRSESDLGEKSAWSGKERLSVGQKGDWGAGREVPVRAGLSKKKYSQKFAEIQSW